MLLLSVANVSGQDIVLKNPSLEGRPQRGAVPNPWYIFSNSPDIQPGFEISLPASNGKTYVGVLYGSGFSEKFAQDLETSLKPGKIYHLSFDLAYPTYYTKNICNGSFAIYGANPNETPELLWESGAFYHTGWQTYTAVLKPKKEYRQIVAGPNYVAPCSSCSCNATAALVDNFSVAIRETPQVEVTVQNTCKNMARGAATAIIKSGVPPFHYSWSTDVSGSPQEGNELHRLKAGAYKVTVTSANGIATTVDFNVGETEIQLTPKITPPSCFGYKDAVVDLTVTTGIPPYHYDMNEGILVQDQALFTQLKKGQYRFKVTDARGCTTAIDRVEVPQPPALEVSAEVTQPVCSDIPGGKLTINSSGGTPPYTYGLERGQWQADNSFKQIAPGRHAYWTTDKNECENSGEIEIDKSTDRCAVIMPNAFSPNGDGLNDIFRPKVYDEVNDFTMEIYNRYGQRIYLSRHPQDGWNGERQEAGAYIWIITYTDSKLQARKQQGSVMLIR